MRVGILRRIHTENELDDLLLPWKIDLALKHRIDTPELRSHIDRVGKVVFSRKGSLGALE